MPVTVVGRYRPLDPFELYWGRTFQAASGERLADVGIFTSAETLVALRPNRAQLSLSLIATPAAFRDSDPAQLAAASEAGALRLSGDGIVVVSGVRSMADRLAGEQRIVLNGVVVGVSLLLLISWLSLILAARRTADQRRSDFGLLKLRGLRRRDLWLLIVAQSAVPLALGGFLGLALGPYLASRLAGPMTTPSAQAQAWRLAAAGAALAVLGAMAAAVAADGRDLSESVAGLSQRVGGRRSPRWVAVVDAAVVALAVAGAFQASVHAGVAGVALLAPLLLALAVGVIAARLVPRAANRIGSRALRSGRVGTGLAALHLARRPGAATVLGVVVVVLAELVLTVLAWSASTAAQEQRAVIEVGAPKVLTVRAASVGQLLAAARAADPASMAVVRTNAPAASVLAVDATRLSAVVPGLAGYDLPQWTAVAAALHPEGYEPVPIRASLLTLDATYEAGSPSRGAAEVLAHIGAADGVTSTVSFGPLVVGRHTYRADREACVDGCRLLSLTLTGGAQVVVHRIDGAADPVLLADRTRWRATVTGNDPIPLITATPDGLHIAPAAAGLDEPSAAGNTTAFVADAPTPLPVLLAGDVTLDRSEPRAAVLGSDVLPLRVAGIGRAMPVLHSGLLTDLEYAQRLTAEPRGATLQVWLGAAASVQAERNLELAGVEVLASESIANRRAELGARGPPTALRVMLLSAVVAVGLALMSFAVSAVAERRARSGELAALRRQGMRAGPLRRVSFGGYLMLAAVAVGLGTVTGLALSRLLPPALPTFADGWQDLPAPAPPIEAPIEITAAVVAAYAIVAVIAGAGLVRAVRRRPPEAPWSG